MMIYGVTTKANKEKIITRFWEFLKITKINPHVCIRERIFSRNTCQNLEEGTCTKDPPAPAAGDSYPNVLHASACLASKGLWTKLSFQECLYSEQSWELKIISSSRAKGVLLISHYKRSGCSKLRVPLCNTAHTQHVPLSSNPLHCSVGI